MSSNEIRSKELDAFLNIFTNQPTSGEWTSFKESSSQKADFDASRMYDWMTEVFGESLFKAKQESNQEWDK